MNTVKYVVSANFKIARKGTHVTASENSGEFIYTEDGDFTIGVMEEIATANKLKVAGKKKADLQKSLNLELSKMKNVAEQNGPTQTEIVEQIIRDGVEADKTDDAMLIEIITAGISFRHAGKMFKETMERLGLRTSVKAVKDAAKTILEEMKFNPKTFDDVEKAIAKILKEIEGSEKHQAIVAIRSYAKDLEIELPKKPKGKRGATGIKGDIFNFILANPNATDEEFANFFTEKGKDSAKFTKTWNPVFALCRDFAKQHGENFAAE